MSLQDLVQALWRSKGRLLLAMMLLFGLGAWVILALPRHYVAMAVLAPAETTSVATSTLLSPAPILPGGLLDNRSGGNFAIYLDALRSNEAAQMLDRETGLRDHLFERRAAWPMGDIRRWLGLRTEVDLDDIRNWLDERLAITPGIATVTVAVSLSHLERAAALDMLRRLHRLAEAKVRADLADLARRRIAAIDARLGLERDLFLRNTLYELLAQQQRTALIVAADDAVAARIVSQPMVEERPSLPNRPLLLLLLALAVPAVVLLLASAAILAFGAPHPVRTGRLPAPLPAE